MKRTARITLITIVIGVLLTTLFKLVYREVSAAEVMAVIVLVSFLLATLVDLLWSSRSH